MRVFFFLFVCLLLLLVFVCLCVFVCLVWYGVVVVCVRESGLVSV